MSYQKHLWVKNEIIRAKQLNHIEDGIYNEEQRATNEEELISQAVQSETSRATLAESALSNNIARIEGSLSNYVQKTDYASTSDAGVVKVDGTSITIDESGVISSQGGSGGSGVSSFNGRSGNVLPALGDYVANIVGFDNTSNNFQSTTTQDAIEEVASHVGKVLTAQTLAIGATTLSFTDSSIGNNSRIRVISNPFTSGLLNAVQNGNTVTLTFDPQEVALSVTLEVRN